MWNGRIWRTRAFPTIEQQRGDHQRRAGSRRRFPPKTNRVQYIVEALQKARRSVRFMAFSYTPAPIWATR